MESLRSIGGPEDDPLILDPFSHIFSRRISKIKPLDGPGILLPSSEGRSGRIFSLLAKGILYRRDRDKLLGPLG